MCGRFILLTDLSVLCESFGIQEIAAGYNPGRNICPGQQIAAVIHDDKNRLVSFRWGLVPAWARDPAIGSRMFNARAETLAEKPSFKRAFQKRRCLIPVDGFYEWQQAGKGKRPLCFSLKSELQFGLAGLYETWISPEKFLIHTCTIITTESNELIRPIHDRMPAIVPKDKEAEWLDPRNENLKKLSSLLKPYPSDEMAMTAVDARMLAALTEPGTNQGGRSWVQPAMQESGMKKSWPKSTVVSPVMRILSDYIASVPTRELPPAVAERAKHHLLDTVSAMVSGSRLLPGRRAIDYVSALGGAHEATVLGTNLVATAPNAALANGMLAHADETDDAYYIALVHPGCSVVPAALAMAERQRSDGPALLRAIVLGYDICARISKMLGVEHFRSAGHSTHSFGGTFGSAAAAGALAGLDADRARYLLSYAAQQASGLSCWARDVEHIEKAFHFGGMPARNGVTAATMVAAGFTAVEDVFSGDRGFFHAYESFAQPKLLVHRLGSDFDILQTAIKRWPVGYPIQAPLDALANLIAAHRLTAPDVERVLVAIDEQGARTVNKRRMASINIQHLMAMMLLDGEITFASAHDNERVGDPAVLRLKKRIELSESPELSRAKTTQAVVEIVTRRGERFRHHTRAVRGSATNPMSRDEVALKSRDLLVPVLGSRRTEALIDAVWNLERIGDVRDLRRLLRPA